MINDCQMKERTTGHRSMLHHQVSFCWHFIFLIDQNSSKMARNQLCCLSYFDETERQSRRRRRAVNVGRSASWIESGQGPGLFAQHGPSRLIAPRIDGAAGDVASRRRAGDADQRPGDGDSDDGVPARNGVRRRRPLRQVQVVVRQIRPRSHGIQRFVAALPGRRHGHRQSGTTSGSGGNRSPRTQRCHRLHFGFPPVFHSKAPARRNRPKIRRQNVRHGPIRRLRNARPWPRLVLLSSPIYFYSYCLSTTPSVAQQWTA